MTAGWTEAFLWVSEYVEKLNSRFREELSARELFVGLGDPAALSTNGDSITSIRGHTAHWATQTGLNRILVPLQATLAVLGELPRASFVAGLDRLLVDGKSSVAV